MANFRENGDVPPEARAESFSSTRSGQPRIRNIVSSSDSHGDAQPPFVPSVSDRSKVTPSPERSGRGVSDMKGPPGPPDEPPPPSEPAGEEPDGLDSYILAMQQTLAKSRPLPMRWTAENLEENKTGALEDTVKIVQDVLGDESIDHHTMVSAVRDAGLSVDELEGRVARYNSETVDGASLAETTRVQQYISAALDHGIDSPEATRAREKMGPVTTFADEPYARDVPPVTQPQETPDSASKTHTDVALPESTGTIIISGDSVHIGDVYDPPPGYQYPDVHIGKTFVDGVEQPPTQDTSSGPDTSSEQPDDQKDE